MRFTKKGKSKHWFLTTVLIILFVGLILFGLGMTILSCFQILDSKIPPYPYHNETVKCYDRLGNEILGLTCVEKVADPQPFPGDKWAMLGTGIFIAWIGLNGFAGIDGEVKEFIEAIIK